MRFSVTRTDGRLHSIFQILKYDEVVGFSLVQILKDFFSRISEVVGFSLVQILRALSIVSEVGDANDDEDGDEEDGLEDEDDEEGEDEENSDVGTVTVSSKLGIIS